MAAPAAATCQACPQVPWGMRRHAVCSLAHERAAEVAGPDADRSGHAGAAADDRALPDRFLTMIANELLPAGETTQHRSRSGRRRVTPLAARRARVQSAVQDEWSRPDRRPESASAALARGDSRTPAQPSDRGRRLFVNDASLGMSGGRSHIWDPPSCCRCRCRPSGRCPVLLGTRPARGAYRRRRRTASRYP